MYLLLAQNQEIRLQRNSTFDTMKKKNVLTSNNDDLYPPTMPATIVDPKKEEGKWPFKHFLKKLCKCLGRKKRRHLSSQICLYSIFSEDCDSILREVFFSFQRKKVGFFQWRKGSKKTHGCFQKLGLPQNGSFTRESPIKMDDFGGNPPF